MDDPSAPAGAGDPKLSFSSDRLDADASPPPGTETVQVDGGSQEGSASESLPRLTVVRSPDHKPYQEFHLPIWGLVRLTPAEVTIANHPAFQRLGDIYQLGQVHLVYRGATHRRLEHALGTLYAAELMIERIQANAAVPLHHQNGGSWSIDAELTNAERAFVRLGALLHDIGHLPAGHTLEDELGLLDAHDDHKRLKLVLEKQTWFGVSVTPTLLELIDELYADPAEESGLQKPPSEIFLDLVSKSRKKTKGSAQFRIGVCRDIIGNTICADLVDYLHRDWYHLGKPKYFDARLIEYLEIRRHEGDQKSELVIYLRRRDQVRIDAVTAIIDLLESRYQLGENALFHHTKLTAAAMLERIVTEISDAVPEDKEKWLDDLVEELLECSDSEMLALLGDKADELRKKSGGELAARLQGATRLVHALRMRRLYRRLMVAFEHQLANDAVWVQQTYGGSEGAENRRTAIRHLESDFGLPAGSIVMYCPKRGLHTKIAEVQILVDGEVYTLDAYEHEHHDSGLTGGHLAAQKSRFNRLWRIHMAMERDAWRQLEATGQLGALLRAVDVLVLGRTYTAVSREQQSESIARELATIEGSRLHGRRIVPVGAGERGRAVVSYPSGAPTLLSFVPSADR